MSGATTIPETMRAMVLTGHGGPEKLEYRQDWPTPSAGDGQVLIKVGACGLNNTDVNTRTGWYSKGVTGATTDGAQAEGADDDASWGGAPIRFPRIQGADVCGVVVSVGAGADPGLVGRRVLVDTWLRDWTDPENMGKTGYYGSECDGGFAEYTTAPMQNVHPVESPLSDAELATFATSYITAENMLRRANVGPGDRVLVTGASGGVGTGLIQLAHRRGAKTVALAGGDKKEAVSALGPRAVLPRSPSNLRAALRDAVGWDDVTVVADVVGGPVFGDLIDVLARGGRYTVAGAIAGPIVDLDLRTLYLKDLVFTGATVIPPGLFAHLVEFIEKGEIAPVLAATYPLAELNAAQAAFIAKAHVGAIVVEP